MLTVQIFQLPALRSSLSSDYPRRWTPQLNYSASPPCRGQLHCQPSTLSRFYSAASYVTTDGQSASLSWCQAPIWGPRPDFITVRQLRVCWYGALSLTRGRICSLHLLLILASVVLFLSDSRGTRDFPFRRLLRHAGLRLGYSTWPPLLMAWGPRYIASGQTQ
jgi:hypothetical protein